MGLEDGYWFPTLNEEGIIFVELFQSLLDLLVRFPIAGCAAGSTVYNEVVWVLGDFGIQNIVEHPKGSLYLPVLAVELGTSDD
jgi:hypothetical protein